MQMHRETFCQMSSHTDTTATPVIFLTDIPNREKGILSSCNQTHCWTLKHNVRGKKRKSLQSSKWCRIPNHLKTWNYLAPSGLETFNPMSPIGCKTVVGGIILILALKRSPRIWTPCWAIQQKLPYEVKVLKQSYARPEQVVECQREVQLLFPWSMAGQRWMRICLSHYIGLLLH